MAERDKVLSGAAQCSRWATLGYWAIAVGHLGVLRMHFATDADAMLFSTLALVELALAVEAGVYGIGGYSYQFGLPMLSFLGRVRLLGSAIAWPWLLPWLSELACRCGTVQLATGQLLRHLSLWLAGLLTAFYVWGELQIMLFTPPSSDSVMGVCLPSQTLLAGQFRLDKQDLEETGRAVFVPAQPRQGLYIGAGLALLCHVAYSMAFAGLAYGWLLLGSLVALAARWFGQLPPVAKKERGVEAETTSIWRREAPRLACRLGELLWITSCVLELSSCEASGRWRQSC